MKNKISSYDHFLNESRSIYDIGGTGIKEILPDRVLPSTDKKDYMRLRGQFAKSLSNLTEFYNESYSNLAPTENDPDEDYKEIKSVLSKSGWTINSIKNLFSYDANFLCDENFFDFVKKNSLDQENGYIDILLYKLVEELALKGGKIYLGGEGWDFEGGGDDNEYLIKCAYGYHQTKYGQLYLKNRGVSESELIDKAKSDLFEWIKNYQWDSIIYDINRSISSREIPFSDYCLEEDDRIVIYSGEIADKAKELGSKLSLDDVISNIYRYLSSFKLDINVSDDKKEVVIYLQPYESR